MYIDECREKSCFKSKGEIELRGVKIPYDTVCEDNFFYNDDQTPLASIFSYAYLRSDIEDNSNRPIIFAYNGGPGSASLWLHMGLFGPRRVKIEDELHIHTVPPFELEDNPHCLLDMCDIVMVDPIGTGLGRLFDDSKRKEIYTTDADVTMIAQFIENWLIRHGRRNSPVLLAGESYGTGRTALLVGELLGAGPTKPETMGVSVSGIMLLGSYFYEEVATERDVLGFTSLAATRYFHKPVESVSEAEFVAQAEKFAENEYLVALYKGDSLPEDEKKEIAKKVSYFTGVCEDYILRHKLRVDRMQFMHELLRDRGEVVGFYDGRYTWPEEFSLKDANIIADDPAMGQYTPAFQAGFGLMLKELGITFTRSSKGLSFDVNSSWDRSFKTAPAMSLGLAMRRNPSLRVFFANGLYDLCTTAGMAKYIANHSGLDLKRVKLGVYPSGHMAYLGEESAKALADDMREFFEDSIKNVKTY